MTHPSRRNRVLWFGAMDARMTAVQNEGSRLGMRVIPVRSVDLAIQVFQEGGLGVEVYDQTAGTTDVLEAVRVGANISPGPRLRVLIRREEGISERVQAVRAGFELFIAPDTPARELMEIIDARLREAWRPSPRILFLDSDPNTREAVALALRAEKMEVEPLADAGSLLKALLRPPDLLLMEVDLPRFSGPDLCRVVRGDPRWSRIPVAFLTGHASSTARLDAWLAGADDFIVKPVSMAELVARLGRLLHHKERA